MKKNLLVCIAFAAGLLLVETGTVSAATPGSGTLGAPAAGSTSSLSWSGGPFTAVTADPSLCSPLSCDDFYLTVNVPSLFYATNPTYSVRVKIAWDSLPNDFDLYVYDSTGTLINSSAQGNTTFEEVDLGQLTSGTFHVQIVAFTTVNEPYSGVASLAPPSVDPVRYARYRAGHAAFSQPQLLLGPNGVVFGVQDLEPRSAVDSSGNIYVAAINGIPAGTDVWKSSDGGSSFTYLGQPDGAQAASALAGRLPGAGGGDEDIAVTSSGILDVASLWIGSVTNSVSTNGGSVWVANPVATNVPLDDRQWIATHGPREVYLTFKQLGVLLSGTESIFVLKSFDGGLTFPQITEATTPALGVQPGDQGNIAVDENNGYVYTVFIGQPANAVYLARSTDGGLSFTLSLVHRGAIGVSYANVFPIIAVDRGGNLHVVFSDGASIFLCSSGDDGVSWNLPVRVSNGIDTKTSLSPWIDAGDAGQVDITWWGTSSSNNLAPDAQWKMIFAQTQNALSQKPTILQNEATGVFHTGPICVNGTGCATGTRDLAEYASNTVYRDGMAMIVYPDNQHQTNPLTYFTKQTSGPGILSQQQAERVSASKPEKLTGVPQSYALEQNFPNPFNPSTIIEYSIPQQSRVELSVFDILGQKVATLVSADQAAGNYSVQFNATHLSSGVYIYKLLAGNSFESTRRMIILK